MSTHCLTTVYIGGIKSKPIVCLHRRHDGDREQHGKELQDFLNAEIADGFTTDMERLAADVVGGNGFAYLGSDITLLVPNAGCKKDYNYHVYLDSSNKLALGYTFGIYNSILTPLTLDHPNVEPKYTEIAEFVYKSAHYDAMWKWRKIGVVSKDTAGFLTGYDLNDENKFKKFNLTSVLDIQFSPVIWPILPAAAGKPVVW